MPNYRQKNRNRNKNKNRNKQHQQQQQQQQAQEHSKKSETPVIDTGETPVQSSTAELQASTAEENATTAVGPKEIESCNDGVPPLDEPNVITCGTVSSEPAEACIENASTTPECSVVNDQTMGNAKSKTVQTQEDEHSTDKAQSSTIDSEVPSTPRQQAKVIVHRIVCEGVSEVTRQPESKVKEDGDNATELQHSDSEASVSAKVNDTIVRDSVNNKDSSDKSDNRKCESEINAEEGSHELPQEQVKVIIHQIHIQNANERETSILSPVHIEEVGDESLTDLDELRSPVVSEVESSAEYEDVDTESDGVAETSSSAASQREKRKQKRLALENHFLPQMLNPRFLDSISEENSDLSECGDNPLSRSESLENAANPNELKAQKLNAKFPKSSLDFSRTHKHTLTLNTQVGRGAIREEPLALAVEARFQEAPDADESCTTLKSFLSPESELAEMVFINSASSSMSDLNEMDAIDRVSLHSASSLTFDLDTDAKDLINKPGAEKKLTSSSSAGSVAVESLQNNGEENASNNVNNSRIPSSVSSPAIDQLVFSNAKEEQDQQSPSTLFSYGSGQQRFGIDDAQCLLSGTQARLLETSCDSINTTSISSLRADKNAKPPPQVLTENVQNMNTVRDILNTDNTQTANPNGNNSAITSDLLRKQFSQTLRGSPPPPPIPPPPTTLDTESPLLPLLVQNIEQHNGQHTEDQNPHQPTSAHSPTTTHKPLASTLSSLTRQESLDSHCSDSTTFSQCTAINVGSNYNKAFDHTSSISDLKLYTTTAAQQKQPHTNLERPSSPADPKKLRLLCAETLAALPYGDEVLEELATLAQNIGEVRAANVVNTHSSETTTTTRDTTNMPYPLPELPHIDDLQLCLHNTNSKAPRRPPSPNRPQSWLGVPTTSDPKVLVCLSPSQRSYMQQQQHVVTSTTTKEPEKPDDLLDAHQRFVERRGYHEYSKEQLANLEREKLAEQQLLQTAAIMKKLRKSLTPPPPQIPPPPVPAKSSETAAIAQNLSKRSMASTSSTTTITTNNDVTAPYEGDRTARSDGEENKHRLLSIIHDTSESRHGRQQQKIESTATSSVENNSRQTSTSIRQHPATPQQSPSTFIVPIALTNGTSTKPYNFPPSSGNMQSVESSLGEMFPSLGSSDIFNSEHKRFSNIESSPSQPLPDSKPKRYSCIESHSYESKKRVENGQVVQDYSNSKHEKQKYGDAPETETQTYTKFPSRNVLSSDAQLFSSAPTPSESTQSILTAATAKPDDHEIMSALKLNKHSSETMNNSRQTTTHTMSSNITKTEKSESNHSDEVDFVKRGEIEEQQKQNTTERMTTLKRGIEDTYEEFRQRAKEAAAVTATATPAANMLATAQITSNGESAANGSSVISSSSSATTTNKTVFQHDHEKLFKEFDDLSKQLNKELEMGKTQREQKEKSTSLYDLNRIQLRQKEQIEEFNKHRHGHMKELEKEIERSMKSRQLRMGSLERPCSADLTSSRTHEIPIQLENGHTIYSNGNGAPFVPELPRTYQIPIQTEIDSSVDDNRSRRAESMFDLSTEESCRRRTYSTQTRVDDDWSKYASDLGSSENITRPFAKEVEICYQRRPGGIRAPRMTASTNDLSYNSNNSYDQHNAYNVRRSHAPMLNRAPQKNRPHYGSCYSMIERDPNPKYISTTSRRGVSPAPQPSGFHPMEVSVSENEMRQRRASLPRELHEQQLKYITSKEEELRTEFERLQNDRRRLMEEISQASTMPLPQSSPRPMMRDPYRGVPKLPTLTEDEVFRQQMAEEWLNKVAEREKRRLHNIIKISKLQQDEVAAAQNTIQKNLGDEFLNRVKERRTKLAMPADSDWESGAESHPANQAQFSETEDVPPVKILEGESEANLRSLPRHLREFAKFSNHQRDEIEGGHREQHQEEERSQEATDNSFSKAFKKSTVVKTVKTVKTLRAPMLSENGGQGRSLGKTNGYQSEPEPTYDSDYSTVKYRPVNPQRLHSVSSALNVRNSNEKIYGTLPNPVKSGQSTYKNQPGRIENYVTGHSSVSEKESKEQLDQAKLSSNYTEGNLSRALAKESGYTSDSNLVFRKKELHPNSPLSPVEQKQAYKSVQAGGEPPLFGFRKPAPEKSRDYDYPSPLLPPPPRGDFQDLVSPSRYYESDVNIHFKTPVRQEFKSPLSEEELTTRQAEHMQKLYQEERRRKYLQELQDMNSRRHTDNFTPSQKSPIALNRYDDFPADLAPKSLNQIKSVARALYNFQAQNSKELSFKKGDIIYIRRAIDKNWYEGEHNAMIGLFPANYVEVINKEPIQPAQSLPVHRKPSEGQARAKYNFQAQSGLELSLNKGELVALTRRVDDNWFEGRIANRKGIFPISYVEVLTDIGAEDIAARTTTTIQHVSTVSARPSLDALRTNVNNEFNSLTRNGAQAPNSLLRDARTNHKTDILHVDTSSEPLVYRALYKYRPQNSDELELLEGDIVHVLEKCDDGWYVGTSQRSGCFGTFPGNYVERI